MAVLARRPVVSHFSYTGLVSLLVFPLAGLTILRGGGGGSGSALGDRDVPVGADGQRPLAVQ